MPMPLMPPSPVAGAMPGNIPSMPTGPQGPPGLSGLLGASPAPAQMDPQAQASAMQSAMQQFDQLAQQVESLARMFPGNEDLASQVIDALQQWRSSVVVSMSPASAMMPGASQMM